VCVCVCVCVCVFLDGAQSGKIGIHLPNTITSLSHTTLLCPLMFCFVRSNPEYEVTDSVNL
jgi:hypothetical protein